MSKNKKAMITLEFAIGIVLSILILIAVVNIISGLFRINDSSKQSFDNLVSLIKDVSGNPASTVKTTALRMDKETFIIGFAGENEPFRQSSKGLIQGTSENNEFNKSNYEGCEKNKSCICLCRKLEIGGGLINKIKCGEDDVFCESFDNVNFTKSFVISRHSELLQITSTLFPPQFRTIYVEKYKGTNEKIVAVCKNPVNGSCVSEEYKKQREAIQGLNELAEFIESCKDREFSGELCSCGAFDFKSEIPEKYIIEFTELDERKLKLILKHEDKDKTINSVEVDVPLCTYQPKLKDSDDLPKDKEIIISKETPAYYTHYKGNDEDYSFIVFVKNNEVNVCILRTSERGYLGMYEDYSEMITFKSTIRKGRQNLIFGHEEINITGCGDSTTDEE